jgi:hypothetical protein
MSAVQIGQSIGLNEGTTRVCGRCRKTFTAGYVFSYYSGGVE